MRPVTGEFTAYAVGVCYASACTSLTDAEATTRLNAQHPTGVDSRWEIADEAFRTGEPNGITCHDRPDTHRHLLFAC